MGLLPKEDLAELTMPGIPKTRSLRVLKRALQAADITISLPMNSHQAIKDPLKRATYEASYINGIVNAEKFGYNINDPLIVNLIENLAPASFWYPSILFLVANDLALWIFLSQSLSTNRRSFICFWPKIMFLRFISVIG